MTNEEAKEIIECREMIDAMSERANEALDRAIKALEQEPKTGRWILQPSNKEQDERDFIWWKCSECGQVIFSETEQDRREYHAYCGRCGAKMEVEE